MNNIIEFVKSKNKNDEGEWLFNLSVYGHPDKETSCFITEVCDEYSEMSRSEATREASIRLDDLSFLMKQWAEKDGETERGEAIAVVTIYAGGQVQVRRNADKLVSEEQKEWLVGQIDAAKEACNG